MRFLRRLASGAFAVAWLAGLPVVHAATLDITAQFRADSGKPNENTFVNTTRNSGYCAQFPAYCESAGIASLSWAVGAAGGPVQANHEDVRQGVMLKAPVSWRKVQVTHTGTGHTETLEFRVVGIGGSIGLTPRASEIVGGGVDEPAAKPMIFGSPLWQAPSPCTSSNNNLSPEGFFWRTPTEGVCAKRSQYQIARLSYDGMSFAYELRTPKPMRMTAGRYQGSLTLSVGPGQDFDFGDVVIPNDPVLTLNFTLDVEHVLKIEVPPGGNRIELEPPEGWQAWLSNGGRSTALVRDQMFYISASSPFKMGLECQYSSGWPFCEIRRPGSASSYVVQVLVTLPAGVTYQGNPVNRRPVSVGLLPHKFLTDRYIDREPATLHFEIDRDSASKMIAEGRHTWSGGITVIWDAEV